MSEKDVPRHHPIGLNAMFKAVELPAGVTHLNPSLSYVNAYHLPHRSLSLYALPLSLQSFSSKREWVRRYFGEDI